MHYMQMTSLPRRFLLSANGTTKAAEPPEGVAVESDFVVILAALLCALICVVGLIAVARCAWLRRGGGGGIGRPGCPASANKGLKKKVLQSLPKFTYDSSANGGGCGAEAERTAGECAICLAEYADGDEVRVLPQCGHSFHLNCIDTWLGSHSSCPSCRQILVVARCRKCGESSAIPGAGNTAVQVPSSAEKQEPTTGAGTSRTSDFLP